MAELKFTTVAELIEKLKEFPQDLKICGYDNSMYAEKVNLFEQNIKANDDGFLDVFNELDHKSDEATRCLFITFDHY